MKLTKAKLKQIIKEELGNLMSEESSSDYDRAKEWLKGVHRMMRKKGKIVPMEMRDRLRGILGNGGAKDDHGMIPPLDHGDVMQAENEAQAELYPRKDPIPDPDRKEADPRPYGDLGSLIFSLTFF